MLKLILIMLFLDFGWVSLVQEYIDSIYSEWSHICHKNLNTRLLFLDRHLSLFVFDTVHIEDFTSVLKKTIGSKTLLNRNCRRVYLNREIQTYNVDFYTTQFAIGSAKSLFYSAIWNFKQYDLGKIKLAKIAIIITLENKASSIKSVKLSWER